MDADDFLTTYDYQTGEYTRIPGTEDWELVLNADSGGGYDWTTFRAFYSPSARRYFWHGDSGCSCNAWGDGLRSPADFEDGDKESLRRGLHRFADYREWDTSFATEVPAAAGTIHNFIPTHPAN